MQIQYKLSNVPTTKPEITVCANIEFLCVHIWVFVLLLYFSLAVAMFCDLML